MLVLELLTLAAVASPALAAFHPSTKPHKLVHGAYIIKVDAESVGLAKRGGVYKGNALSSVLADVEQKGIAYKVRATYDATSLFQGASITVTGETSGADLAALTGVQDVWPVHFVDRPRLSESKENPRTSKASKPVKHVTPHANATLAKREDKAVPYSDDTFYTHSMSGVQKSHTMGKLGAGVKIGLIDTGVDYKNPILGGCFGKGCHIAFGYDFVGDLYNGTNNPVPDPDPYENCPAADMASPHGTMTSGVVGALKNEYGFTGVAPEATLGMYRIFSCQTATTEDIVLAAYIRAVQDECDVINMSFGGAGGWLDGTPVELMVDLAAKRGIATTVSPGNSGAEGLFFSQQPASSRAGFSVNSVDTTSLPAFTAQLSGILGTIPYIAALPIDSTKSLKLYFTSDNSSTVGDACEPLPSGTPALADYVTVVQRGGCTLPEKYANVVAAGGKILMIYNNAAASNILIPDFGGSGLIAAVSMLRDDGLKLLKLYSRYASSMRISFPDRTFTPGVMNPYNSGQMSAFSTYGPTSDMYPAVTLAAPGGPLIIVTVPAADGLVSYDSGTSFSAPYLAGAIAIIKGSRKGVGLSVGELRDLLATTSSQVTVGGDDDTYSSVSLQGSGLIQLARASSATSIIQPAILSLNDSAYFNSSQYVSFRNIGKQDVYYTVAPSSHQTLLTYENVGDILPATTPPVISASGKVIFDTSRKILVKAGRRVKVKFTFAQPNLSSQDAARFPVWSGSLRITEQPVNGGRRTYYRVSYLGLAAKANAIPVLDTTDTINGPGAAYPFLAQQNIQTTDGGTYTFSDGPTLYFRQAGGSKLVTIDLVKASIDFTGTVPTSNNAVSSPTRLARSLSTLGFGHSKRFGIRHLSSPAVLEKRKSNAKMLRKDVPVLGSVYSMTNSPRDYLLTNTGQYSSSDQPQLFSGNYTTPEGANAQADVGVQYRLLLRALKVYGDPIYEESYESWLSPSFTFTG